MSEIHYPKLFLKKSVFSELDKPKTTRYLSKKFNRSFARIQDVLIDMKKEGKVKNYRVYNRDFWTNNTDNIRIISHKKMKYLNFLRNGMSRTYEFSNAMNVCFKASHRRLKELEKLGIVKRNNKNWGLNGNIEIMKKRDFVVVGIEEAGS
ncbi:MAG: hypothetical protein ISS36_03350 [Candidatus Aenigmarchaeota archaeon]|nr:hypothetical protein [Candidatus Aenigmarchaeota archaeon]